MLNKTTVSISCSDGEHREYKQGYITNGIEYNGIRIINNKKFTYIVKMPIIFDIDPESHEILESEKKYTLSVWFLELPGFCIEDFVTANIA